MRARLERLARARLHRRTSSRASTARSGSTSARSRRPRSRSRSWPRSTLVLRGRRGAAARPRSGDEIRRRRRSPRRRARSSRTAVKLGTRTLKKGRVLTGADIAALKAAGHDHRHRRPARARRRRREPGRRPRSPQPLAGARRRASARAFTGRANFYAEALGLVRRRSRRGRRASTWSTRRSPSRPSSPYAVVAAEADGRDGQDHPLRRAQRRGRGLRRRAAEGTPLFHVVPFKPHRVGADPDPPARPQGQHPRQDRRRRRATGWPRSAARLDRGKPLRARRGGARRRRSRQRSQAGARPGAGRRRLGDPRPARRDPGRDRRPAAARSSISACRSIPAISC